MITNTIIHETEPLDKYEPLTRRQGALLSIIIGVMILLEIVFILTYHGILP